MFKGQDFVLDPNLLEKDFQLVEVADWIDFNSKEKLGTNYTVLLPKCRFEKIKVGIKNSTPIISADELAQKGQVAVVIDGLQTKASLYNGRLSVKAEATSIKRIAEK